MRKPFQGVVNIVRFNWHFYVIAAMAILFLLFASNNISEPLQTMVTAISFLILFPVTISLSVSLYVYDLAGFYKLEWLGKPAGEKMILNIHSGFDETSSLLKGKYKEADLIVLDFYDPAKHTEVSIKRARKAYPPFAGTRNIATTDLPFTDNSADKIFVILSAHEIRTATERIQFFTELHRVLKPGGHIIVAEHLRDTANFMAFNIGFFHFYSKQTWMSTFDQANLTISDKVKLTPFITCFFLEKNGITS